MLVRKDSSVETIAAFTEQSRKQGCNKHCLTEREKKDGEEEGRGSYVEGGGVRERERKIFRPYASFAFNFAFKFNSFFHTTLFKKQEKLIDQ